MKTNFKMEVDKKMQLYLQVLDAHNFSETHPKLDPFVQVMKGNIVQWFHSQALVSSKPNSNSGCE